MNRSFKLCFWFNTESSWKRGRGRCFGRYEQAEAYEFIFFIFYFWLVSTRWVFSNKHKSGPRSVRLHQLGRGGHPLPLGKTRPFSTPNIFTANKKSRANLLSHYSAMTELNVHFVLPWSPPPHRPPLPAFNPHSALISAPSAVYHSCWPTPTPKPKKLKTVWPCSRQSL